MQIRWHILDSYGQLQATNSPVALMRNNTAQKMELNMTVQYTQAYYTQTQYTSANPAVSMQPAQADLNAMTGSALAQTGPDIITKFLTAMGRQLGLPDSFINATINAAINQLPSYFINNPLDQLPPFELAHFHQAVNFILSQAVADMMSAVSIDAINDIGGNDSTNVSPSDDNSLVSKLPGHEGQSLFYRLAIALGRMLDNRTRELVEKSENMEKGTQPKDKAANTKGTNPGQTPGADEATQGPQQADNGQQGQTPKTGDTTQGKAANNDKTAQEQPANTTEKGENKTTTEMNEQSAALKAEARMLEMLSNAVDNILKTLGQALSNLARK